ncbi:MAG: response regulator transcription factor [bacterium]|nr:response regulator transcription factor [bacterium]
MQHHILVIEDDEDIQELLRYNLGTEGYKVSAVGNGPDGLKRAKELLPDLIILDRMLPGMEGLDVCKNLKNLSETSTIPVIMLTAKGEDSDVVAGLELGADDYLTKPFSPKILIARVRNLLRRTKQPASDIISRDSISINLKKYEVRIQNDLVKLTSTEFKILHLLVNRPGWVFSRDQIVDSVHGDNYAVTDRSVDVQITGLRKKLGVASDLIETIRGVGYRFRESDQKSI